MSENHDQFDKWLIESLKYFYREAYTNCKEKEKKDAKNWMETYSSRGCCINCKHTIGTSYVKLRLSNYFWIEDNRAFLHYNLCDDAIKLMEESISPDAVDYGKWAMGIVADFKKQYDEQVACGKATADSFLEQVIFNNKT